MFSFLSTSIQRKVCEQTSAKNNSINNEIVCFKNSKNNIYLYEEISIMSLVLN